MLYVPKTTPPSSSNSAGRRVACLWHTTGALGNLVVRLDGSAIAAKRRSVHLDVLIVLPVIAFTTAATLNFVGAGLQQSGEKASAGTVDQ